MDLLLARTDTRVVAGRVAGPPTAGRTHPSRRRQRLHAPRPARRRYHEWHFDPATQSFGHPAGLTPDWLVIADSPLRHYASADPGCVAWPRSATTPSTPSAARPARAAWRLRSAGRVLPAVLGLAKVERPGPTITIYRRRKYAPLAAASGCFQRHSGRSGPYFGGQEDRKPMFPDLQHQLTGRLLARSALKHTGGDRRVVRVATRPARRSDPGDREDKKRFFRSS